MGAIVVNPLEISITIIPQGLLTWLIAAAATTLNGPFVNSATGEM
jgi:hypothetical protein